MTSVIIVASGNSDRFGKEDKLLSKIGNDAVIQKTCQLFLQENEIEKIIVVCKFEIEKHIREVFKNNEKIVFTNGGCTRSDSVKKGLKICKTPKVLIHDGARPFASQRLLNKILQETKRNDAVVPWIPVTNTLKKINPQIQTLNREDFIQTQTPQGFSTKIIKLAYKKSDRDDFFDDCEAVENLKLKVRIKLVEGEISNKKITFIEDLSPNT
ncbi:2-C-methyl-D-erythritol 4-phosphate cytidylyltransferase [Spiroplasma sabaudiense Ar-1343]|uniref:2-C-methyl-D-erythritol 4-phosphate cytidylyltransferase n=1 Tax=Spiroplasma sabaudiense Ar-1343 TaxID=1276257 RepID=W6A8T7_9MOLU|nr:IspD/TarI family cytidylyltransferase [Spiroplasma sabaudiense]AHI53432.1 2-C-methyl-D-erythritol 4-phosphate cytidylyltransferase [Spiroplasma sabaudiense Ar-1343]